MEIEYVPLLQVQRELQSMPLGMTRFRDYLGRMTTGDGKDVDLLPMVFINPMAKEHVTQLLDEYLGMDADGIAKKALHEKSECWRGMGGVYHSGMVICDDLKGGWTNRYSADYNLRFGMDPRSKRFWVTGVLWSSEKATPATVKGTILAAALRTAFQLQNGLPKNLNQRMAQEGYALCHSGSEVPEFDLEELEYTREVIKPYLLSEDIPRAIQCLFGDQAGETLGFPRMGLSPYAGLSLARFDAARKQI